MHKLPTDPEVGDMVAYNNRVLQVWVGNQWYLLGGEKLPLVSYDLATSYLLNGWGEPLSTFELDLQAVIPQQPDPYYRDVFITRCLDANKILLENVGA